MLLKNASIWYREQIIHGHVLVDELTGLIKRISLSNTSSADSVINLKGKLIIPSLVDIHCHLRDFEESHKETYETGALAAAAGGFTTIFDMPNKINPINSSKSLNMAVERADRIQSCEIIPYVLLNKGTEASLISNYPYSKAYLGITTGNFRTDVSEVAAFLIQSSGVLAVHCEDNERINNNLKKFQATLENHGKIRDPQSEVLAIKNLLETTKDIVTKGKLHIAHVTLLESIGILHSKNISFEVTPHHLFLNNDDLYQLGVKGKMNPPLRSKLEQKKLLEAFLANQIPIISTDHAPHTKQEKEDLELAGVPGLETCLPLLFHYCKPLDMRKLKLIINALAINPRVLMNLSEKGIIVANEPANLTVIDRKKTKVVRGEDLRTKCKWSPWEGYELLGWPVLTIREGKIAFNDL
ncbi:MAG: dihydroorotase family protein [Candidatus Heimdallarchaeota archaeon]|nr:MAG: dihydroorotase family protein [Candidatus Heimdallarchaeota archaeon]